MADYRVDGEAVKKAEIAGVATGGAKGALAGASLGASIGSVAPGVGTLLGAGIGALAGLAFGAASGGATATKAEKDAQKATYEADRRKQLQAIDLQRLAKEQQAAAQLDATDSALAGFAPTTNSGTTYDAWRASVYGS